MAPCSKASWFLSNQNPVRKEIPKNSKRCENGSELLNEIFVFRSAAFQRKERWKENHGHGSEGSEKEKRINLIHNRQTNTGDLPI